MILDAAPSPVVQALSNVTDEAKVAIAVALALAAIIVGAIWAWRTAKEFWYDGMTAGRHRSVPSAAPRSGRH